MPAASPVSTVAQRDVGRRPLQITAGIPAAVAISAATTFERMPPEPSGEVVWPIVERVEAREVVDLVHQLGPTASVRGSAV